MRTSLEDTAGSTGLVLPSALKTLAVLRIATGFVFLWAFLDKAFGLRYSTSSAGAWVHGGSPTKGFLSHVVVGPLEGVLHSMAGAWWVDLLFMLGMLAVGVAAVLGVALRPAAVAGTIIMALMWLAEFPPAQHTSAGQASGSTNPIVDYHVVYALALIVCATTYAGHVWGLAGGGPGCPWCHATGCSSDRCRTPIRRRRRVRREP